MADGSGMCYYNSGEHAITKRRDNKIRLPFGSLELLLRRVIYWPIASSTSEIPGPISYFFSF